MDIEKVALRFRLSDGYSKLEEHQGWKLDPDFSQTATWHAIFWARRTTHDVKPFFFGGVAQTSQLTLNNLFILRSRLPVISMSSVCFEANFPPPKKIASKEATQKRSDSHACLDTWFAPVHGGHTTGSKLDWEH